MSKYIIIIVLMLSFVIKFPALSQIVADTFYIPNYPIPEIYFTDEAPELPDNVWNHKLEYFPQYYYNQHNLPNCGQASGHFYCLTYEFNRLLNRRADSSSIFSSTHIFNYLNGGNGWYGVSTFDSWNVVMSQGDMFLSDYYEMPYIPEEEKSEKSEMFRGKYWENGYEKYYAGMKNRILAYYSLNLKTDEDLRILMHYFNDHLNSDEHGGVAIFYANPSYVSNDLGEIAGIISPQNQNVFDDTTMIVVEMYGLPTHSMTLVGYCKNTFFDFNNDGLITDTIDINGDGIVDMHDNETILWIVINSWGDSWRNSHFFYKYDLLAKVWNQQAFFAVPDTAYQPELTFKIKLKHPNRQDIKISAGISSDLYSDLPEQLIDFPIWNYQGGDNPMTGVDTLPDSDILEFGIDVSDLKKLKNGTAQFKIFMRIENSGMHKGELQSLSIIDYSNKNHDERVLINEPVDLLAISDNLFSEVFSFSLFKSDSVLDVTSPTKISSFPQQITKTTITPIDGQEPYEFHILQKDEYSVSLHYQNSTFGELASLLSYSGRIYNFEPVTIEPEWDIIFGGKTYDFLCIENSGTIAISNQVKHFERYPYQTLLKSESNYLQINPFLTNEHARTIINLYSLVSDTAISILTRKSNTNSLEDGFSNNYFVSVYLDGKIQITYPDNIPKNKIFANIKTNTNKYYIPYEKAISDTFNTVIFTPNSMQSLFSIDEDGVLTMQSVSETGKYETYVIVRDAKGQEFTKRIEINVIDQNIIGNLYPNPTKDILYCDIYSPIEQNTIIEIFTITGQLLSKKTSQLGVGISQYEFNTDQYHQGIYLIRISLGGKSQTHRFVVTK